MQHYAIKFVGNLRQVSGFLWVFRFPDVYGLPLRFSLNYTVYINQKETLF